jgi:hypothetical protein
MPPEENQNPKIPDWFEKIVAGTPGSRILEARQPGTVAFSPVGQEEPQRFGINAVLDAPLALGRWVEKNAINLGEGVGRFFSGQQQLPTGNRLGDKAYYAPPTLTEAQRAYGQTGDPRSNPAVQRFMESRQARQVQNEQLAQQAAAEAAEQERLASIPAFEDILAQYQFDGSPYDNAGDYLQRRRMAQMEAVQNMYNEYAAQAQQNAQSVADIYSGAEAGIGETYGGARDVVESAYGSAQQQAADQMARLGIEETAPAVINPMALSQAEDVSNLAANEAAGTGAIQRYGATGRDFASNMAQVAQQQGMEIQGGFLDQLADQLFELEMQRAQAEAAYNPYARAMEEMQARQTYQNTYFPQPEVDAEAQQRAFEYATDTTLSRQEKLTNLAIDIFNAGVGRGTYEDTPEGRDQALQDAMAYMQRAESVFPLQ